MKWKEFICSLLDFMPSDTLFCFLNVNLFVDHFMFSFDFFCFVVFFACCCLLLSSLLCTYSIKLCVCALWFADGSFVLYLIQLNLCDSVLNELWAERVIKHKHTHARSHIFSFPSICLCYLLCFQKSFLVIGEYIGGALNVCTILRGKQIVISNWKWAWAHPIYHKMLPKRKEENNELKPHIITYEVNKFFI